jgi:hypothetical protein
MDELPKGWTRHVTKEGKEYFYNSDTKKSSWTKPVSSSTLPEVTHSPIPFQNDGSFMDMIRSMNQGNNIEQPSSDANTTSGTTSSSATSTDADITTKAQPNKSEGDIPPSSSVSSPPSSSIESTVSTSGDLKRKVDENTEEVDTSEHNAPKVKSSRFKAKSTTTKNDPAEEYLRQVQALQDMDKGSDSTGGKWLVR